MRYRWTVTLVVGLPAAVMAWFLWAIAFHDGRQDLDLATFVGSEGGYDVEEMPNARLATDEICDDLPCIQAVTSDTLTMYRYEHREMAVAHAEALGDDGYLTGWMVVQYEPGGLTAGERTGFEYFISCVNTWVGEEGQDC